MASEFVRWICVDTQGKAHEVTPAGYAESPVFTRSGAAGALLRQFVSNELGGRGETVADPEGPHMPAHVRFMRAHELVDYCDVSEKGHLKWYPKGLLIRQLLMDEARRLAHDWGALEMANPVLIKADSNAVGELMAEFRERDYRVDGGRGTCWLRYASDPLAFPFMQKVRFGLRQAPLKVYEEASCFRNEQEGEVGGLRRVRNFSMTDMHAACATEGQAHEEFEWLTRRFAALMRALIARDRWVLGWEGTVDFYEANRDWLLGLGRDLEVPAFFKLMDRMSHYYAMKNEFQSITADGANVQISTVQWDVKDGARFQICYRDASGSKVPCPVILHASSFGSVERSLCALLENAAVDEAAGIAPALPYWLSPVQLRILPVSASHLEACLRLAERVSAFPARCDVDDREETVGRRIRDAERDWIPFLVVAGEREGADGPFSVRMRREGGSRTLSLAELRALLQGGQDGLPYRVLPTRMRVSENPVFHG